VWFNFNITLVKAALSSSFFFALKNIKHVPLSSFIFNRKNTS